MKTNIRRWIRFEQEIQQSIAEIAKVNRAADKKLIVVVGDMLAYDKGICNYLNKMSKALSEKGYIFLFLSEAVWVPEQTEICRIDFKVIKVPEILGKNYYRKDCKVLFPYKQCRRLRKKRYLVWAEQNFIARYSDMPKSYARMLVMSAEQYYSGVFALLRPYKIILWNEFYALHQIVQAVAKEQNIPLWYMEFGSIPGTFALEREGQMGESYPAVEYKRFLAYKVDEVNLQRADRVWKYLFDSRLNRNVQQTDFDVRKLLDTVRVGRPVIFYAGQNDYEAGLVPYTIHSRRFHSPVFMSSYEAAVYLSDLARKNDWILLYKPHPLMQMLQKEEDALPENIVLIKDADINDVIDVVDVTVTILSQTGYMSIIRRKPVVMLGYTQLRGKGCTYEVFEKGCIEQAIRQAIQYGFTGEQEKNFRRHLAQLFQYYLFDDLVERDLRYGQDIYSAAALIEE